MKISQAIKELERLKEQHGDMFILIKEDGFGGHAIHTTSGFNTITLSTYEVSEGIDEGRMTIEDAQEIFPEMTEENYEEIDDQVNCLIIQAGTMIYAT